MMLNNGCLCCTVRGDLVGRCRFTVSKPVLKALWFQRLKLQYDETLSNLAFNFNLRRYNLVEMLGRLTTERKGQFDHILIETTGLANPAPIIQTFYLEPVRPAGYCLLPATPSIAL